MIILDDGTSSMVINEITLRPTDTRRGAKYATDYIQSVYTYVAWKPHDMNATGYDISVKAHVNTVLKLSHRETTLKYK